MPLRITDHELIRCIGSGSYGEVWLARTITGTFRAVKVVYRQTFSNERPYEREFNGMQKFEPVSRSHDSLVDILQLGRNDAAGYFYYVMELGDDRLSGQRISAETYQPKTLGEEAATRGRLPFDECLELGLSLAAGLSHLHKHGLIHRDIKPSNIIYVNGSAKIADIGLVAEVGASKSFVGTQGFMPPEGPGSVQADIYSLGKVLYEISTGHDRQAFPELPTQLDEIAEQKDFLELNAVILRACESDVRQRYRSADELHRDLLLLQAGKSVKRLRLLERRLRILRRTVLATALIIALAGGAYYRAYLGRKNAIQRLAASFVANGTRSIEDNDFFGSLPWFAEALRLQEGDQESEKRHRTHLGVVLRQCPKIVRLWVRDRAINDAEFSLDGRWIVTAGDDHAAVLWDAENDQSSLQLLGHSEAVQSASFSRDGKFIVTASWDKTARIWDAVSGAEIRSLAHPATVYSAEFDRDGSRIVTACADGKTRIWEWRPGRLMLALTNHTAAVRHAAFSPAGHQVLSAGDDCTAVVYDLLTGVANPLPLGHDNPDGWIYDASYSPNGRYIVTASFDKTARVFDTKTGLVRVLQHRQAVRSAQFSPDGRFVLTACWDYNAQVWDTVTGKAVTPPLKHSSYLMRASFSPDSRHLVTASTQGVVLLWDLASNYWLPPSLNGFLSSDGSRFATINGDIVQVADSITGHLISTISVPNGQPSKVMLNQSGSKAATISGGPASPSHATQFAELWDASTGKPLSKALPIERSLEKAELIADGKDLIILAGTVVEDWNLVQGKQILSLPHPGEVTGIAVSPDTKWISTAAGKDVYLWDLSTGKLLRVLSHEQEISHMEFSPDGSFLVTATTPPSLEGGEARVWNFKTGHPVGNALKHDDGVRFASFSPDSRFVVTASEDKTAQVWITSSGERRGSPLNHKDEVVQAVFSPDGHYIVTACRDATARIWNAENLEPVTPPLKHKWGSLAGAQFVGQGLTILSRRLTPEAKVWSLPRDDRPVGDLVQLAQLLSGHQSDHTGGALPLTKEALLGAWQNLRAKYPADFTMSREEIIAWHQREVEDAEEAKQWSAAMVHWDQLILLQPDDSSLRLRRERARLALSEGAVTTGN